MKYKLIVDNEIAGKYMDWDVIIYALNGLHEDYPDDQFLKFEIIPDEEYNEINQS